MHALVWLNGRAPCALTAVHKRWVAGGKKHAKRVRIRKCPYLCAILSEYLSIAPSPGAAQAGAARARSTESKKFREVVRELAVMLAYEATQDIALEPLLVQTP